MNDTIKVLIRVLPFLVIIIGIALAIKKKKITAEDIQLQKPEFFKRAFFWWMFFLLFILLTETILYHFNLMEVDQWQDSWLPLIIKIIGIVILAPIAEELVFRGLILHKLRRFNINLHLSIIIQAVIFVVLHSINYNNIFASNFGILQLFMDAMLFAYARVHTKSLYTPMAMHSTGNLMAVLQRLPLF